MRPEELDGRLVAIVAFRLQERVDLPLVDRQCVGRMLRLTLDGQFVPQRVGTTSATASCQADSSSPSHR
jgi:hypothetical protein